MVDNHSMDFGASVKAIAEAMASESGHPSAEELLGYHAGELGPGDEEQVRKHLATCPGCARIVLDMETFPAVEPIDSSRRVTTDDVARTWGRLQLRLREETSQPITIPAGGDRKVFPLSAFVRSSRFAQAAAAIFLIAAIGLFSTTISLRREIRTGREPRLNLLIFELVADQEPGERSGAVPAQTLEIGPSSEGALIVLPFVESRSYPRYGVGIKDPSAPEDRAIWSSTALARGPQGIFTFELPRGFLPPGRYEIEVRGWTEGESEVLATYDVNLRYP